MEGVHEPCRAAQADDHRPPAPLAIRPQLGDRFSVVHVLLPVMIDASGSSHRWKHVSCSLTHTRRGGKHMTTSVFGGMNRSRASVSSSQYGYRPGFGGWVLVRCDTD